MFVNWAPFKSDEESGMFLELREIMTLFDIFFHRRLIAIVESFGSIVIEPFPLKILIRAPII